MEKLKARINRKDDVVKFKNYCREILEKSDLKEVKCFVCGSSEREFVLNVFGFDYVQCLTCSH
ncbi:MAG: hypothetical protein ABH805_02175, partial [Candidatus Nealsonbacteria bacterium]